MFENRLDYYDTVGILFYLLYVAWLQNCFRQKERIAERVINSV